MKEIPNDISMTGGTDCIELHLPGDITEHITVHDMQKAITTLQLIQHMEKQSKSKLVNVIKMSCCIILHN